jgi:hypothetical protein
MALVVIPQVDGQVVDYAGVRPTNQLPRIYYVNGIQTDGVTHAKIAIALSILTSVRFTASTTPRQGRAQPAQKTKSCRSPFVVSTKPNG